MGINFGTANPKDFKFGSNAVSAIYLGSTQVWPVGGGGGSFTPMAVLLTSGTSYTVPSGASYMTAFAVGPGGIDNALQGGYGSYCGAGGVAYKTWSVSGGSTVTYAIGVAVTGATSASTSTATTSSVTFSGTTIKGYSGFIGSNPTGGSFTGGDGGSDGGSGNDGSAFYGVAYGALGGATGIATAFQRTPMNDIVPASSNAVSLLTAVGLAGGVTVERQGANPAAFGSGGAAKKYTNAKLTAGYGGGWGNNGVTSGDRGLGAIVLYFK